jgi:hypothetical protein
MICWLDGELGGGVGSLNFLKGGIDHDFCSLIFKVLWNVKKVLRFHYDRQQVFFYIVFGMLDSYPQGWVN